jgi:hypothetical protein
MKWFWEERSNTEYQPPQIATFLDGWVPAKADLKSEIDPSSEVFVRELVQNFVDASNAAATNSNVGQVPKLSFRFVELRGAAAKKFAQTVDLENISARYQNFSDEDRMAMRLPQSDSLRHEPDSIQLLVVSEAGSCGMSGPWDRSSKARDESGNEIVHRMRDALLATVRGSAGKGLGAYGEGKKAVIGVSAPRTLFAYTCFNPETTPDGVSRRFMGGVYWQNYEINNTTFSGFAMLGDPSDIGADGRPRPYQDSAADAAAESLELPGLSSRKHEAGQSGTTLVFLEPKITPAEVTESLVRNWWPLLVEGKISFEVLDKVGDSVAIDVPEYLQPFIAAYKADSTNTVTDWDTKVKDRLATNVSVIKAPNTSAAIGELKLAIDLYPVTGWSRLNPESNQSIVALIRDGMVIAYQHFPRSGNKLAAPFVRGTFVTLSQRNGSMADALRYSEPPLHNKWNDSSRDLSETVKKIARATLKGIQDQLFEFRNAYLSATPTSEVRLEVFEQNLQLVGHSVVKQPDPGPTPTQKSPWSMLSETAKLIEAGDRRIAHATRVLKLAARDTSAVKSLDVAVELGWEVLEDGSWKDANQYLLHSPISAPRNWTLDLNEPTRNRFLGTITDAETLFEWQSEPYRELWTLRPYMKVELTSMLSTGKEVESNE